jgi:hypothetical protein
MSEPEVAQVNFRPDDVRELKRREQRGPDPHSARPPNPQPERRPVLGSWM